MWEVIKPNSYTKLLEVDFIEEKIWRDISVEFLDIFDIFSDRFCFGWKPLCLGIIYSFPSLLLYFFFFFTRYTINIRCDSTHVAHSWSHLWLATQDLCLGDPLNALLREDPEIHYFYVIVLDTPHLFWTNTW